MSLSRSLQRFLTLYEFDQGATDFALDHMVGQILAVGDSGAYVTRQERAELLRSAFSANRRQILQKTLIDIGSNTTDLDQLSDDLASQGYDDEKWVQASSRTRALVYKVLREQRVELNYEDEIELQRNLEKLDEEARKDQVEQLIQSDVPVGLTRWFAQNLDSAASAVAQMDDTDFKTLVPDELRQAFRECHINAVLGNYVATIIVCGVILERGLKHLMNEHDDLNVLIASASKQNLLVGRYSYMADHVRKKRNQAVHELSSRDFTSDDAWDVLSNTRKLTSHIYRDWN